MTARLSRGSVLRYIGNMLHTKNRERLVDSCQGALIIIAGHESMQLSGDMAAPFLQEANFWWLTGIEESGWKLIVDGARSKSMLVRPYLTESQQVFDGSITDDDALSLSGVDKIITTKQFEDELVQLARSHTLVMTTANKQDDMCVNPAQHKLANQLERTFAKIEFCDRQLAELRAIKQPEEVETIKKAIGVSVVAYENVRNKWAEYKYEYEVEADFTYAFSKEGHKHAYAPIVAGGHRACTLHYDKNNQKINKRDCVVIDIGARVQGYAADITRTYCANPTKRQRQVHNAVQQAQSRIVDLLGPNLSVVEYINGVDDIMKEAIIGLGLMKDKDDQLNYRKYFPHAVSHGLGVDVHDSLASPRHFRPGMVLTVEPGIYIPEESIGVRIEDDILITDSGHINLSKALSTDL